MRYGTEEQKAHWLGPLLEGKIRSCFAMTEPQVPHRGTFSGQTPARPCGLSAARGVRDPCHL